MNMQNIMQIANNPQFRAIANSKNPQQAIIGMAKSNPNIANNPLALNMVNMLERGDTKALEGIAKNLVRESGLNIEEIMKNISH